MTTVSAVGAVHNSSGTAAPRAAGLSAELAKSESELADWVYCPSSKTPEGKHKIQQLTDHIDLIKARIESADQSASSGAPKRSATTTLPAAGSGLSAAQATPSTYVQVMAGVSAVDATSAPGQNRFTTTGVFVDRLA